MTRTVCGVCLEADYESFPLVWEDHDAEAVAVVVLEMADGLVEVYVCQECLDGMPEATVIRELEAEKVS